MDREFGIVPYLLEIFITKIKINYFHTRESAI